MGISKIPVKNDSDPVIVYAVRTPLGKAGTPGRPGAFSFTRPEDLAATVIRNIAETLAKNISTSSIKNLLFDDIHFGCVAGEGAQGYNIAQIAANIAGISPRVPARTTNRFCASGLQSIMDSAAMIRAGFASMIIAGGIESMSAIPMSMTKGDEYAIPLAKIGAGFTPHPELVETQPESYIATILGAEILAQMFDISREAQDSFSFDSHMNAIAATQNNAFDNEIVPLQTTSGMIHVDEGPRLDTSKKALASLKPILHLLYSPEDAQRWTGLEQVSVMKDVYPNATVTAGNASQMTDGAAAVLVMSRKMATIWGLKPLARIIDFSVTGIRPEYFGLGPVDAIEGLLRHNGLTLQDIDLFEINEAFAVQVLAVLRKLEEHSTAMNLKEKLNVNGGAIALGHPLGCTGARIATTLIHEMKLRDAEFGIESMCVGGGMGAAALFQLEY